MRISRERISRLPLSQHLGYATGWTMVVHRTEPNGESYRFPPGRTYPDPDIVSAINKFTTMPVPMLDIAKEVLALPRVAQVDITDMTGMGESVTKSQTDELV